MPIMAMRIMRTHGDVSHETIFSDQLCSNRAT